MSWGVPQSALAARIWETGNEYTILVRKTVRKILLQRPRRRCKSNIKIKFGGGGERWSKAADKIDLSKGHLQRWAFVNMVTNSQVQQTQNTSRPPQ
jgi:hypothetical protein